MSSILKTNDPWSNMLQKGTILWRHCSFQDGKVVVRDVNFEPTEKRGKVSQVSYIGRIVLASAGMWEPEVWSNRLDENTPTRGIAVFLQELPPANWTHLVIAGVSKPFGFPGRPTQGGCVFASVVNPYDLSQYRDFRLRMYEAHTDELRADIDRAVEISEEIWPNGVKSGDSRLIVQKAWVDDAYFRFHLINYHDPK